MKLFDQPLFEDVEAVLETLIDKNNRHISIEYQLSGKVLLSCDRCLKAFWHPVGVEHRVYYSFEPTLKGVEDEDLYYIDRNMHLLDISQDIYDLLSLQIPYRKIPEDCPTATCPTDFTFATNTTEEDIVDSPFAALLKINKTEPNID